MESTVTIEKKWVKMYPIYLDKAVKVSEGRKVSLANAAENPTAKDIYTVCTQFLGLQCKMEPKSHPKDWMKRGRVIVQLKEENGKLSNSDVPTKNQLCKTIGSTIWKYKEKPAEKEDDKKKNKKRRK